MVKLPTSEVRAALDRERRTNKRLRALVEEARLELRSQRHDLDLQFRRIAQMQAELDELRTRLDRAEKSRPVNRS
jgi:hypothetical protein